MFDIKEKKLKDYIYKRITKICLITREIRWLNEKKQKRKLKRKKLRKEEKDSFTF